MRRYTSKHKLRRQVFTEVAKLAYEGGDPNTIGDLPYKIIPGEVATYRESVLRERAIVSERLRLAIGLPVRPTDRPMRTADGVEEVAVSRKCDHKPLINIIKVACDACPPKKVTVSNLCRGCLEHPCVDSCPKDAVSMVGGKSFIDQEKCIQCGRCVTACPYNAIVKQERPCEKACGVGAIHSDEYGRAEIDYEKCVSCGQCLVSCPFSAIADKSQIYQTILALREETPVYAAVAPAFAYQFGRDTSPEKLRAAIKALGFADMVEVAIGADLCTLQEAEDFLNEVPDKLPWMGTSCCPSWSVMAKRLFPQYAECISMALTPMVLTARLIKKQHPACKVAFIGPCAAKKREAARAEVRSEVDFVLTFEEVAAMFDAKELDFAALPEDPSPVDQSSADGRLFAVAGGVAKAVVNTAKQIDPSREIKTVSAEGLAECRRMLQLAKAGKYDGYLLEGMACPGGCVGGAGVICSSAEAAKAVSAVSESAPFASAVDTHYGDYLDLLIKE